MAGRYLDQQMPFIGINYAAGMPNFLTVVRDDFRVRLFKNKQCIKTIEEVYCDNLGETIDELVEKPTSMSEEEYYEKAKADSMAKLIG